MRPTEAARRWADTWQRAWEALDTEPIVALYATGAVVSTAPFREPAVGPTGVREYVSRVFGEEAEPRVWMGEPIVEGERAAVSWWASLLDEGTNTTLAGTSMLRFNPDGQVTEQWDTWNVIGERLEPPRGWGQVAGGA